MFGIVKQARMALGGLVCAAVVMAVPVQAFPKNTVSIKNVVCAPSYATVTCTFNTSVATQASVATGTSKKVVIPTTSSAKATAHSITVRGLEPGVNYVAKIQAGGSSTWTQFATLGPGSAMPPTVTTQGHYWLINGQRFIPVVDKNSIWGSFHYQDVGCIQPNEVASELTTGAKIVLVDQFYQGMNGCGASQSDQTNLMHQALAGRMWWNIFGQNPLVADPSQPQLAEVVGWVSVSDEDPFNAHSNYRRHYLGLFPGWEVSGFVLCQMSRSWDLYDYLSYALGAGPQLTGVLLGGTFAFNQSPQKSCESPTRIANEFWTSVGLGAGVAWDEWANQGEKPDYFNPVPRLVTTAGKLSGQLATIAPALLYGHKTAVKYLGKKLLGVVLRPDGVSTTTKQVEPIKVLAWWYGGNFYLLSINTGGLGQSASQWRVSHPATVSVRLKGLTGGSGRGLWGSKGLKLNGSIVTIHLPANSSGWYVIKPKK